MAEPLPDYTLQTPGFQGIPVSTGDCAPEADAFMGSLRPIYGRMLLYIVLLFVAVAIAWAWWGKVDVVASAPFRLVPQGNLNLVQAPRNGEIEAIAVAEGDQVTKGQVLFRLRSDETLSELQALAQARAAFQQAEYEWRVALPQKRQAMTEAIAALESRLVLTQTISEAHRDVLAGLQVDEGASSDVQAQIGLRQAEVEHLKLQYEREQMLFDRGLVSRADVERARVQYLGALAALPARLSEIYRQEQVVQDLKQQLLETRLAQDREVTRVRHAYEGAKLHLSQAQRRVDRALEEDVDLVLAPEAGVVTQVLVTGQVVVKGQVLLGLAPEAAPMVAEVMFLNKNVGLIALGQSVKLKYDAFAFQDYGIKRGWLRQIAPDAVMDDALGPVFRGIVELEETDVRVAEGVVPLRFGMKGMAEVVTDRQPILMRLLSPLRKLQGAVVFSE